MKVFFTSQVDIWGPRRSRLFLDAHEVGLEPITAGRVILSISKIALTLLRAYVGETRRGETSILYNLHPELFLITVEYSPGDFVYTSGGWCFVEGQRRICFNNIRNLTHHTGGPYSSSHGL